MQWFICFSKWLDKETNIQVGANTQRLFWDLYIGGVHYESHWVPSRDEPFVINIRDFSMDFTQDVGYGAIVNDY
jgi:hypothetical protein